MAGFLKARKDPPPVRTSDRTTGYHRWDEPIRAAVSIAPFIRASLPVRLSSIRQQGFLELNQERGLEFRIFDRREQRQEQKAQQRLHDGKMDARSGQCSIQLGYGCLQGGGLSL